MTKNSDTEVDRSGDQEKFFLFREQLKSQYGEAVYQSWFEDLLLDSVSNDSVTLSTASRFKADAISQRYKSFMREAWSATVSPISKLSIVARKNLSAHAARVNGIDAASGKSAAQKKNNGAGKIGFNLFGDDAVKNVGKKGDKQTGRKAPSLSELASPLDPRATFENFAIDDSNRVAHAAGRQIFAETASCDIVYIYGPSGIGKTHLLNAIGNEWKRLNGADGCAYFTYNNMISGCVGAVLSNNILSLHQDMLKQQLVEIDDIHLLVGRSRTEEEILNLVNAFAGSGRKLVIAGALPPSKLAERGMNARLADRLAGGLCVPITTASNTLRAEVLKKRLAGARIECAINDEAISFIAEHFTQSTREAIGALNQLFLVYGGHEIEVGPEEARAALSSRLRDRPRRKASPEDVLKAAADAFDLTVGDLTGRAQPQRIVRGRHAFVYVCREKLKESFPQIAAILGRDHTTAMSSYRRAQALYEREEKFRAAIADICAAVGA